MESNQNIVSASQIENIPSVKGESLFENALTVTDSSDVNKKAIDLTTSIKDSPSKQLVPNIANEFSYEFNNNIDGHNIQSTKIYSDTGECIFEGSCIIGVNTSRESTQELIDFEELIDLTREVVEKQEFESVLANYQTSEVGNNDYNKDLLNVEDVNDFFLNFDLENNNLFAQTSAIQTNQDTDIQTEKNNSNDEIKLETQSNDSIFKLKTVSEEEIIEDSLEDIQSINSNDYNSSDFEFITENETKMDPFIINFSLVDCSFPETVSNESVMRNRDASDPGEGPSGFNDDYNRDYREEHEIPNENDYMDLFQGPGLPLADIVMMENKSTRPSAMNIHYEGIGFDIQLKQYQVDSSEEEFEDEAQDSIQKIMSMYPHENRKLRRSRRF